MRINLRSSPEISVRNIKKDNEADLQSATIRLIENISLNYTEGPNSRLTPVLHTEKGIPINEAYINLALVKEKVKEDRKEGEQESTQKRFKEQRMMNSHEHIYGKKERIELADLFAPTTEKENKKRMGKIPKRLLLEGWAGIGKTSCCQFIANQFSQKGTVNSPTLWSDRFKLVLWIPLRNLSTYTERKYSLADVVKEECLSSQDESLTVEVIDAVLKYFDNHILLILDGLDEAMGWYRETNKAHGHPKQWSFRCQLMRSLINQKQHCTIMTTRPGYLDQDLREMFDRRLEMIGFTDENINAYVEKYFERYNRQAHGQRLLHEIRRNPNLKGIAHIPINLALMCLVWRDAKDEVNIPERLTMTQIYSGVVLWLLRRDRCERLKREGLKHLDGSNEIISEDVARQKSRLWGMSDFESDNYYKELLECLEALAWNNQCAKHERSILIPGTLIVDYLKEKGVHPEKIDEEIIKLNRIGLLNSRYQGKTIEENDYYFPHLTFQEYFAANYWVKLYVDDVTTKDAESNFYFYKYDKRFEVVWRFTAGLLDQAHTQSQKPSILDEYFELCLSWPIVLGGNSQCELIMHGVGEIQDISRISNIVNRREIIHYLIGSLRKIINSLHVSESPLGIELMLFDFRSSSLLLETWKRNVRLIEISEIKSMLISNLKYDRTCLGTVHFLGVLPWVSEKYVEIIINMLEESCQNGFEWFHYVEALSRHSVDDWSNRLTARYKKLLHNKVVPKLITLTADKNEYLLRESIHTIGMLPWGVLRFQSQKILMDTLLKLYSNIDWGSLGNTSSVVLAQLPWEVLDPEVKQMFFKFIKETLADNENKTACFTAIDLVLQLPRSELVTKYDEILLHAISKLIKENANRVIGNFPFHLFESSFLKSLLDILYSNLNLNVIDEFIQLLCKFIPSKLQRLRLLMIAKDILTETSDECIHFIPLMKKKHWRLLGPANSEVIIDSIVSLMRCNDVNISASACAVFLKIPREVMGGKHERLCLEIINFAFSESFAYCGVLLRCVIERWDLLESNSQQQCLGVLLQNLESSHGYSLAVYLDLVFKLPWYTYDSANQEIIIEALKRGLQEKGEISDDIVMCDGSIKEGPGYYTRISLTLILSAFSAIF